MGSSKWEVRNTKHEVLFSVGPSKRDHQQSDNIKLNADG